MKKPLIVLAGPTAVGKTEAVPLHLQKRINGEIISAGFHAGLPGIWISVPPRSRPEEMEGVRHYLMDVAGAGQKPFHVVLFQQLAKECHGRNLGEGPDPDPGGRHRILYSGCDQYDIDFTENEEDTQYRDYLEKLAEEHGAEYLHRMLKECDPTAAEQIHANNSKESDPGAGVLPSDR